MTEWDCCRFGRHLLRPLVSGTQDGPFLKAQDPTNRSLQASIMLALQLDDDGMVTDSWLGTNFIWMLGQLGWGVAPEGKQVPGPE